MVAGGILYVVLASRYPATARASGIRLRARRAFFLFGNGALLGGTRLPRADRAARGPSPRFTVVFESGRGAGSVPARVVSDHRGNEVVACWWHGGIIGRHADLRRGGDHPAGRVGLGSVLPAVPLPRSPALARHEMLVGGSAIPGGARPRRGSRSRRRYSTRAVWRFDLIVFGSLIGFSASLPVTGYDTAKVSTIGLREPLVGVPAGWALLGRASRRAPGRGGGDHRWSSVIRGDSGAK